VGIGEASATPAAFSMISDYFSPKVRATVLAIYSSGIYLGSGIGLFLGGAIVQSLGTPGTRPYARATWYQGVAGGFFGRWHTRYPDGDLGLVIKGTDSRCLRGIGDTGASRTL